MRRLLVVTLAAAVALAALAAVGRAERARWIDEEREGITAVVEGIGGRFISRTISDTFDDYWRPGVSCVRYAEGADPYAMQLCFDPRGRLIEAYDERSGGVVIYDLHVEPVESGYQIPLRDIKSIKRFVRATQAEIRRAAERAARLREQKQAQADRK